jgi:hypothetical protein
VRLNDRVRTGIVSETGREEKIRVLTGRVALSLRKDGSYPLNGASTFTILESDDEVHPVRLSLFLGRFFRIFGSVDGLMST